MTLSRFIITIIIFSSCQTKSGDTNLFRQTKASIKDSTGILEKDTASPVSNFSFVDTLNKYKQFDTLSKSNKVFYIGKLHLKIFGLFQITDTSFTLFQKRNQVSFISDSIPLADIEEVKYVDLNGDGFKDIVIAQDYTAAGANSENVVLLYDTKRGLLKHNVSYDLPNIQYDNERNLVYSTWFASANHAQDKMVYKPSGSNLFFDKGVTYIPDKQTQGENGTVEFYKEVNGKRVITKTMKGKADRMFRVFDTAFWDTSDQ